MNNLQLYNKDCRHMTELPDESVQCCVTSPPYWGLRKYAGCPDLVWGGKADCEHVWGIERIIKRGHPGELSTLVGTQTATKSKEAGSQGSTCSLCGAWRGQFGLEPTVQMYVQHTVEILEEVKRVMRKDGTVFLNLGDSYASGKGTCYNPGGGANSLEGHSDLKDAKAYPLDRANKSTLEMQGLKPKDLCLIPFRVAIAAQEAGWWVRSVIIWSKPNPMPESVTDRPTESHEYILLLTKSAAYYWDQEAVREPQTGNAHSRGYGDSPKGQTAPDGCRGNSSFHVASSQYVEVPGGRNCRSVWDFPTQPYKGAHFAVFPEALPERCIKAATPEVGSCARCGAPWVRIVGKGEAQPASWHGSKFDDGKNLEVHPNVGRREDARSDGKDKEQPQANTRRISLLRQQARENGGEYVNETKTLGWRPGCKCETDEKVPSLVLDPFAGSGTTLWVARKMGQRAVGYELSPDYCKLIEDRNRQLTLG